MFSVFLLFKREILRQNKTHSMSANVNDDIILNFSGREEITTKWLLVKKQEKKGDSNSNLATL